MAVCWYGGIEEKEEVECFDLKCAGGYYLYYVAQRRDR